VTARVADRQVSRPLFALRVFCFVAILPAFVAAVSIAAGLPHVWPGTVVSLLMRLAELAIWGWRWMR
jgi:hypothetical protein